MSQVQKKSVKPPTDLMPKLSAKFSLNDRTEAVNKIKNYVTGMTIVGTIQIGKILREVKDNLAHGEFGKWLEESVNYSVATANKMMAIASEFDGKDDLYPKLSYTKALMLLGLPDDKKREIIEDSEFENMSASDVKEKAKEIKRVVGGVRRSGGGRKPRKQQIEQIDIDEAINLSEGHSYDSYHKAFSDFVKENNGDVRALNNYYIGMTDVIIMTDDYSAEKRILILKNLLSAYKKVYDASTKKKQ